MDSPFEDRLRSARWVYLHGLGSGPASVKAAAIRQEFASDGIELVCPDLRRPTPTRLRFSAMLDAAEPEVQPGTVLLGASLGGLVALHLAAPIPVAALVLFAPALDLHAHRRSRPLLTFAWRGFGHVPVRNKPDGRITWVDSGFLADIERFGLPPLPPMPTLVFHGVRDRLVNVDVSRKLASGHPNVRLLELDDGHDLMASMPAILAALRRSADGHRVRPLPPAGAHGR